jgi:hypothetical protein
MISRGRLLLLSVLVVFASLLASQSAFATNTYTSYFGTSVSFTAIQETSNLGDLELPPSSTGTCCFGAPTGVGDSLLFFPTDFVASASGAGGYDGTGAQLQTLITATMLGATIDQILLSEYGDLEILGPAGTGATGVFASMAGYVTVLEVSGVAVTPIVIGFNAGGVSDPGVTAAFSPVAVGDGTYVRPTYIGTALWNGQVVIDLESVVPNATKVQLSLDNDLYAYTELAGNTAKIQKKVESGPSIIIGVIPEPGTFALLGGGLLALALRARGRRA